MQLQDGVTSTLAFLLLNFHPKSQLRTNMIGHPTLVLLASFLKEQGKVGKSPCNYC